MKTIGIYDKSNKTWYEFSTEQIKPPGSDLSYNVIYKNKCQVKNWNTIKRVNNLILTFNSEKPQKRVYISQEDLAIELQILMSILYKEDKRQSKSWLYVKELYEKYGLGGL